MKLSQAAEMTLCESRLCLLDEDAPKWDFAYDNYRQDPNPEILLLGSYVHPNTQNNLVGGINLNYLDKYQKLNLAKALPSIMAGEDLYARYHLGKRALPDIFKNYYRTYNAEYMRGVQPDVFKTKHGFVKAARDWVVNTVKNVFRTKEQQKQAAKPKYPEDLQTMQDRIDQISQVYATEPTPTQSDAPTAVQTGPDLTADSPDVRATPEYQVARDNFKKLQKRNKKSAADVQKAQDQEFFDVAREQPSEPPGNPQIDQIARRNERPHEYDEPIDWKPQEEDEIPDDQLEENYITYYSPTLQQYVVEYFDGCSNQNLI